MPEKISSTTRLFADDSLVYRIIRSKEDQTLLQQDLDKLQEWEHDWLMQFNADKCEVIRITNKRNPLAHDYDIHGTKLQTVKNAKYLGVTISSDLSWNTHVDTTAKKATTSLNFLKRKLHSCPSTVKDKCFKSLVRPIMEYAFCVWDPHTQRNINKLDMVQRRAARFVKGDYSRTSSSIGATLGSMTSRLPVQDGGPHDVRSKMAAPTTPRWRPPRHQDGGPCDAFGYTSEGESTP